MGSPPLKLLKKWGYQVRVYSSAQLNYYGMETLLFGKGAHLVDSYQTFPHVPPLEAADSDAQAIAKLQSDMEKNPSLQEGQVFIIFWDATHFNYSWPKNWSPKFEPETAGHTEAIGPKPPPEGLRLGALLVHRDGQRPAPFALR